MRSTLIKICMLLFPLLGAVALGSVHAQTQVVTGTVLSEAGEGMPGVNVIVKGTSRGTSSDVNGKFSIEVRGENAVLVFSFIGYMPKEVSVGNRTSIGNVQLEPDVQSLEEVVVIGYQNIERRKSTAAMATVKGDVIDNLPYPTFDQMLQGRVAGLTSLNTSGEPGSNGIVNIRGSNSVSLGGVSYPLYVIDGMIYDVNDIPNAYNNNPLAAINPNDIESIDILKDASAAAIYGSRGANGVILVKTKRAKRGQAPMINVNIYGGITNKPALRDVITGKAERQLKLDLLYKAGTQSGLKNLSMFLTDSLNPAFNNNTDWQSVFVQTAKIYNADASISGATENSRYRLSMGYYNEEGAMIGYSLKRIAPRLSFSTSPGHKIDISLDFSPSFVSIEHGYGDGSNFPFTTWSFPSSFWKLTEEQIKTYHGDYDNLDEDKTTTMLSNVKLTKHFTDELMFTSSFSMTYNQNRRDWLYSHLINGTDDDIAYNWDYLTNIWETENYVTYDKQINDHSFSVIAGQEAQRQTNKNTYAYGIGVGANTITGLAPGTNLYAETYQEERTRFGWFGRVSYDYKERYLFSSSYRRDGSSRYSNDNRWANFYSISGGWILSEEPFFDALMQTIPFLKLRASYGVTGNDPSTYYGQYNLYSNDASYYQSSFGLNNDATATTYNGTNIVTPNYGSYAADKNVTWERYPQVNIGGDINMLDNRVNINIDWYARDANELFYNNVVVPTTSGYAYYSGNLISLRNTGWEFTFNTDNLAKNSPLRWQTTLTLAFNDNYVTKLPNGGQDLVVGATWLQQTLTVGKPLFAYKVWEVKGVYATDEDVPTDPLTGNKLTMYGATMHGGDPIMVDQNGDYNIDDTDKIPYGDPNPKLTGGLTNTFTYKGFTMTVFCTFIKGRKIWNGYTSDKLNGTISDIYNRWGTNATVATLGGMNYWTEEGDEADYGSVTNTNIDRYHIAQSIFVEDGSFFRIKNITLGYEFKNDLITKLKLNRFRVYGMIDNIARFTNSTLPDPEAVDATGYSNGSTYPQTMKFTLGLNANF